MRLVALIQRFRSPFSVRIPRCSHLPNGHSFVDCGQELYGLLCIGTMVNPAVQPFLIQLLVDQVSPGLPPTIQRFRPPPVSGGNGVNGILPVGFLYPLTIFIQAIDHPLLCTPGAVLVQRPDGCHHVEVRILCAVSLWIMDGKVYDHPGCHEGFLQELPRQFQVFLEAQLILQGDIEGVSQLRILSPLGLLYLVPECFPITKPLRRMGREQDFTVQDTVLGCVVAVLAIVVTV